MYVADPKSGDPKLTLRQWKNLFKACGLDKDVPILTRTSTKDILEKVFPAMKSPDKGVWLEYDLSAYPQLHDKCTALIEAYSEISYQSSQLLSNAYIVSRDVQASATTEEQKLYTQLLTTGMANIKDDVEFHKQRLEVLSNEAQSIEDFTSSQKDAITELKTYYVQALDSLLTLVQSIDKDKVNYDGDKLKTKIDTLFTRATSITANIETQFMAASAARILSDTEFPEAYGTSVRVSSVNVDVLKDNINELYVGGTLHDKVKQKMLVVRLYPAQAQIIHGNPQTVVHQLSHNRFITTKVPDSNNMVMLQNNYSLNTLDTQWATFYSQLLTYLVDYGNPEFSIVVGNNKLRRCSLHSVPKVIDTGASVSNFSLTVISRGVGVSDIEEA